MGWRSCKFVTEGPVGETSDLDGYEDHKTQDSIPTQANNLIIK